MSYSDRIAVDSFVAELRRVWLMVGPPSYGDLERMSAKVRSPGAAGGGSQAGVLSRSTAQNILSGSRQYPPRWPWVYRFLTVLQVLAAKGGIDPASLGTMEEWKHKHEAAWAAASRRELAAAAATGSGPDGNEALAGLLRQVGHAWWHEYQDLVPGWFGAYLSLEPATAQIRTYDTTLVPGFLQTAQYAQAVIGVAARTLDQAAVSRLVELRLRRQQLLDRGADAPRLWAIMDEAVLRRRLGSAGTMRAQIKHLIEISRRPNVTVQVIPFSTSIHAVAGGPVAYLRFPRFDSCDVVYLEQLTGALYLTCEEDTSHYITVLNRLAIEALTPATTTHFLREILMDI